MLHADLTSSIIEAFYDVYNALGYGFLEKVYENALAIELGKRGFVVEQQIPINVYYEGQAVGEYWADIRVNGLVILEIKAKEELVKAFEYQLINYLKATEVEVGLVLNFGPKPEFKRKIFTNNRKPHVRSK